jgi:hypothetical protein
MSPAASVVAREKEALAAHRATLRGSELPPLHDAPKGTFLHGFLLPFSLIVATMRDRDLRGPYLRVALLRGLIVVAIGVIAIAKGDISAKSTKNKGKGAPHASVVVHKPKPGEKSAPPVKVDIPGIHVDIDPSNDHPKVTLLGQNVPVATTDDDTTEPTASPFASSSARVPAIKPPVIVPPVITPPVIEPPAINPPAGVETASDETKPAAPPTAVQRAWDVVRRSWGWILALVAFLSATEGVIVFFSRRWDDFLSFHASRLAAIRPEDETPKTPKLAIDIGWLYRKLKRRVRGYILFAAGLPALLPLRLVPVVGDLLFTIAATLWGWYWLGVFSAAKSAHAWADEEKARSPAPIRTLNERISPSAVFAPLRWYGRLWAKITHSVNPAATTFERSPAAFLGLALARVILSLPGLYLLARPIVPVAAGRLCAEADPMDRFSAQRAAA